MQVSNRIKHKGHYYPHRYWNIATGKDKKTNPIYSTFQQVTDREWLLNVSQHYHLDIACDLTFQQRKEVVVDDHLQFHRLNDSIACQNLTGFLHKLNQRVFKNAYKRNNKKLDVVVSLEGGKDVLREEIRKDKNLHTHLSIQRPDHINEKDFIQLLNELWVTSPWGFSQTNVEAITRPSGRRTYHIKNTFDAIVPKLTSSKKLCGAYPS